MSPPNTPTRTPPTDRAAATTERRGWLASLAAAVLGILFLGSGVSKLVGPDFLVTTFEGWGMNALTMRAIGLVEVVGAVLVVIPAVRAVGAGVLGAVMIGALVTHVAAGQYAFAILPLAVLALAGVLVRPVGKDAGAVEGPDTIQERRRHGAAA